jgi:hypothetical protein
MWNNKTGLQVHQNCASPGCSDHVKCEKDKSVQILPEIDKKKERNVAIIAVARKLICLIYHLLINQELYQEDECRRRGSSQDKSCQVPSFQEEHLTDKVAAIVDAFYNLCDRNRKITLMRAFGDISASDQKRSSCGGD